jgi:hypothetical protein
MICDFLYLDFNSNLEDFWVNICLILLFLGFDLIEISSIKSFSQIEFHTNLIFNFSLKYSAI